LGICKLFVTIMRNMRRKNKDFNKLNITVFKLLAIFVCILALGFTETVSAEESNNLEISVSEESGLLIQPDESGLAKEPEENGTIDEPEENGLTVQPGQGGTETSQSEEEGTPEADIDNASPAYTIEYVLEAGTELINASDLDAYKSYVPGDASLCKLPKHEKNGVYKLGYILEGWYLASDPLMTVITESDLVNMSGNLQLKPKWKPRDDISLSVSIENPENSDRWSDYPYPQKLSVSDFDIIEGGAGSEVRAYSIANDETLKEFACQKKKELMNNGTEYLVDYWTIYLADENGDPYHKRTDKIYLSDFHLRTKSSGADRYKDMSVLDVEPHFKLKPADPVPKVKIKAYQFGLNGLVSLKYNLDISGLNAQEKTSGRMLVSVNGVTRTEAISDTVSISLHPKQVDDEIIIRFSDGSGNSIPIGNALGNYIGEQYVTSIAKCVNDANGIGASKYSNLMNSLYNYGKLADSYFNLHTPSQALLNSVSAPDMAELKSYMKTQTGSVSGLKYMGSSLLLNEGTSIRHYFEISKSPSEYEFFVNYKSVGHPVAGQNGWYYIEIRNISPADYDTGFFVTVGTYSLNYSVYSYVYDAQRKTNNQTLKTLTNAVYAYGKAAKEYW